MASIFKSFTDFNEECHHVEELLNVDAAVAVLVKQVEHLHNVDDDDDDVGDNDGNDDVHHLDSMSMMMMMMMMITCPRLSSVLPSQKR